MDKVIMANGEDMILTYTKFSRMIHNQDQESRSSETYDMPKRYSVF